MAYFGDDYEVKISKATALRLIGQDLKMGWEQCIAKKTVRVEGMEFTTQLCVANISGTYQVHCSSTPKDQWLQTFLFDPKETKFLE